MALNFVTGKNIKGLTLFIEDLRHCKGNDEEWKRINKELAKIRSKLNDGKPLNGYQKKKHVCKLIFIFLLGYKCDIGHMLAVNLLSSNVYSEKRIGYLFISVVMGKDCDFMHLVINAVKDDLSSHKKIFQNLALQYTANSTSPELANSVVSQVVNILFSFNRTDFVTQTAALSLLQLFRIKPDLVLEEFQTKKLISLMWNEDVGILTAVAGLIEYLAKNFTPEYQSCVGPCIVKLSYVVESSVDDFQDYCYHFISSPWLTLKLLRILQNYPAPSDVVLRSRLRSALEMILTRARDPPRPKKFDHDNAKFAVIFEAISLITRMEFEGMILSRAITILRDILHHRDANLRFMALDMMTQLASNPVYLETVKLEWNSILNTLTSESDITIRKRAVDLLYIICSEDNVKSIVREMLNFLKFEHKYCDEVILKTVALTERFDTDRQWYFDVILKMLQICGDSVSDTVWYNTVNVVVTNDNVQKYAARKSYAILTKKCCQDAMVKIAGYILGEFGYLIAKHPQTNHFLQLRALKSIYPFCSTSTKSILLTVFIKFLNLYPDMKDEIQSILRDKSNMQSANEEIQQRAVEYLKLSEVVPKTLLASVLKRMPSNSQENSSI